MRGLCLVKVLVFLTVAMLLAGCGGGGGGTTSPVTGVTFKITWPARSRALSTPLTSALSVSVVFKGVGAHHSDVSMNIDRDVTQVGGYTGTYTVSQAIYPSQVKVMNATFYAQAAEQGPVVGMAIADVAVSGNVIQITPITLVGTIKSVSVQPTDPLLTNSGPTQLLFKTLDANGASVAVTPGSAIWAIVSGSSLTLTADGIATPSGKGSTIVTASVDGIVSPPSTIAVNLPIVTDATFQVIWPARSRVLTNPLTSALSVAVVFKQAGATGADVTMDIDRDTTQVGGYTGTYTIPQSINPNVLSTLTATFYAQAAEGGSVVGTATASAVASGTTVNIGSIVLSGVINSVTVVPATLTVGNSSSQLEFEAKDSSGNTVAVTPGSAIWAIASGGSFITLTKDGIASPVAVGTAQVTASVDGISSSQQGIVVSAPSGPSFQTFAISATSVAYDATRNLIYASATASSPTGASMIVPISLATGQIMTPFRAGSNPTYIAVSSDNSHLFAGQSDGVTVERVSLASQTIDGTITLPSSPNSSFSQLLSLPNQPNSFIATRIDTSSSTLPGNTLVVDGSGPRPSSANLGQSATVNDAGTRIFGVDSQIFENPVALADITNLGIENVIKQSYGLGAEANVASSGNVVVVAGFDEIDFLDASTGASLSSSQLFTGSWKAPIAVPGTSKVYMLLWGIGADTKQVLTWDSVSMSVIAPGFSLHGIPGDPEGALQEGGSFIYAGPNRIAFVAPNQVVVVTGLP